MHANPFDGYQIRSSLIHELDPRVKVVLTILMILSNALIPDGAWLSFLLSFGFLYILVWISKVGIWLVLKRSFIALPFALAAITVIFNVPGNPVFEFSIGSWNLVITDQGTIRLISILVRSWLSVQVAILLIAATQFPDLIHALRHLKAPQVIISTISFMYRYLFVLSDEVIRLLRARDSRSARLTNQKPGGNLIWRAKMAGSMAGQLFLRSYERSDRVYNAMLSRGYSGELLTMNPHKLTGTDWNILLVSIAVILFIQLVGLSAFGQ
jgi:cobalt/nickel transport system permease protein